MESSHLLKIRAARGHAIASKSGGAVILGDGDDWVVGDAMFRRT